MGTERGLRPTITPQRETEFTEGGKDGDLMHIPDRYLSGSVLARKRALSGGSSNSEVVSAGEIEKTIPQSRS